MAVVDRQATDDIQPRAWMVTVGDATPNRLVTRVPDQNSNSFGWTDTGIGSLSIGGVAAVAFIDGSTQRQRVFYVKNNGLVMLPYDSDSQGTAVTIAAEAGYTISGDLAAVYWLDGTTKRIIVATGATFNSTAGYTCFFENVNLGASWSVDCSSQVRTTASNLDIVGTVVSNSVEFYFKNNVGGLGRLRRTGNNALHAYEIISAPAAESIMPSVFAIPSQVSSKIELGVITDVSKRVWTGRLTPGQTSPTWIQQPVIPNSDVPVSSGAGANVSIDAMKYSGTFFGNPYTSTNIYVIANWKLYYTNTADDGTWSGQWSTGLRPGDGQLMWGIGATTTTTGDVNRVPRVFLSAGSYTTTLQEFTFVNVFTESLRDHIRKQQAFVEALTSKATESAVAMGPQSGMATAMRRGPEPWACRMDDTTDGANSFGSSSDYEVLRKFTGNWATDPVTDATSGNQFHYVDVEFPVTTGEPLQLPDRYRRRRLPARHFGLLRRRAEFRKRFVPRVLE